MANSRGAELAPFFARCKQCKYGTVGWFIHHTLFEVDREYEEDEEEQAGYDLEVELHFSTEHSPNLDVLSVYEGEDGSVCIDLG